jgi:hypothetical protein
MVDLAGAISDADGDASSITVTFDGTPSVGSLEYFDGTSWLAVTAGLSRTKAQLAGNLRYVASTIGPDEIDPGTGLISRIEKLDPWLRAKICLDIQLVYLHCIVVRPMRVRRP